MPVNVTEERLELSAIDKASAIVNAYKGNVDGLRSSVDNLKGAMVALGALGAVGVAASFAASIRETISWEASLANLSTRTGATVEDLSALGGVARRSGTDMDSVATMLQKLSKSMGEAGDGTSKAAKVFDELKIKTTDSTGAMRPALEVAQELGDKLLRMKDQTLALAFAQETMGKAGANQLPFLRELVAAGELHAKVTTEQAKAAKQFEDSLDKLSETSKQLKISLANELLPSLNMITDAMLRARRAGEGFWGALAAGIQTGLTGDDLHKWNVEFARATENLLSSQQALANVQQQAKDSGNTPFDVDQVKRFEKQVAEARAEVERLQRIRSVLIAPDKPDAAPGRDLEVNNPLGKTTKETGKLSPFDAEILRLRQGAAREESSGSRFIEANLDIQAQKYGELTEAQKQQILSLAALWDQQKAKREFDKQVLKDQDDAAKAANDNIDRINEQARRTVAIVASGFMSEEQLAEKHYDEQMAGLQEALRLKQITQEKYNEYIYLLEDQQIRRIADIRRKGMTEQQKIAAMGYREQAAIVAEELMNMTSTVAQHSRALFELNKLATLATIALKAPEAIASSYAFGAKFGGPYLGAAMAVVAGAAMVAQFTAAAATKFGGSSAPSVAGTTSATPVSVVDPAPSSSSSSRAPQTTFVIETVGQGDSVRLDDLRDLTDKLNENFENGGRIVFAARRRNR